MGLDVNQSHFKKTLQASTNAMKNDYPKTANIFLKGCSKAVNFRCALTKSIKLYFLKFHFRLPKQVKIHIPSNQKETITH